MCKFALFPHTSLESAAGGGTTFAGLSVFPPVPKKYIGFLSLETQTFEKKRTKMHTNEEGIFCIVIMIYLFLIHMLQDQLVST
ncbi:uncharacterized protein LOC122947970 isoform X4 [Acropora millepora]|uniref:uncharacterized protein LOC122947970 isoform X4 n=1 Tax=Acropora millepora TaxID=45264 RepID=UPI001CF32B1E|nr:uncharacterized protein LOC122947970 isoform X4 [Acropora millepora]